MKSFVLRLFPLFAALAGALRADEPAIIAKARAYLGSEADLDRITSLRMEGTFSVAFSPPDPKQAQTSKVDIVFQKPWRHRLVVQNGSTTRTVALDGYDAWERVDDPTDPRSPRMTLYSPPAIRAFRADVWENLGYYRGLEAEGGSVVDKGPAKIDGIACEQIAFIHDSTIIYNRYFDLATGRLVFTQLGSGLTIRESGERVVDGVKFPTQIVTTQKTDSGGSKTTTLTLEKIVLNEPLPDQDFATPLPPTSSLTGMGPVTAPAVAPTSSGQP